MSKPTYHATAEWDGRWWAVKVTDLPDGYAGCTQGRTWVEAESMTREAIALLLDVPEDSFDVELTIAE